MTIRITISCLVALLCSSITPASSEPYNIMVGCWKGKGDLYTPDGVYKGSVCSRGVTSWKTRPTLMHFREEQQLCSNQVLEDTPLKGVIAESRVLEYDLRVDNRSISGGCTNCGGTGANINVIGTETHTDVYHFHLNFQNSGSDGNWYNNHYFTGRNRRHVLGSFEPAGHLGEIAFIAVQTLKRVPCTLSQDDKRERRR
jgi:hypothetical protein